MNSLAPPGGVRSGAITIVASYERVSSMAQARLGFSLGTQAKDAALLVQENGWELPQHLRFVDGEEQNASGADWNLEGLNAMLAAAKRQEFTILLVPDVDRFARNMIKALVLEEELRRFGVRVIYRNLPTDDSPEGRFLKHSLFNIAEYEREKIRLRTARNRREKAQRGLFVGNGDAPFGYRYVYGGPKHKVCGLEPEPETSSLVQRIFREAGRDSIRTIAARLNAEGVRPQRAGRTRRVGRAQVPYRDTWAPNTIRGFLRNPVYRGVATYGRSPKLRPDGKPGVSADRLSGIEIPVPALVDEQTWQNAQRALDERRTTHSTYRLGDGDRPDPFELRGRVFCGHCQDAQPPPEDTTRAPFGTGLACKEVGASSRRWETGRFYYCVRREPSRAEGMGCPVCQLRYVRASTLEELAWEKVTAALMDPDRLAMGVAAAEAEHGEALEKQEDRLSVIEAEIGKARTRLGRILDELLDVDKGSETYGALMQRQQQAEAVIRRLTTERQQLAAPPTAGLSRDEAGALEAFAAEVQAGLGYANSAERAEVYRLLRLRAVVRGDEKNGARFGRGRFTVSWEALIPLCNDGSSFL